MASPAAFEAIEDHLRSVWNASPLVFENETATPPAGDARWVFVEVYGTVFDQASIGAETREGNLWREEGMLWLHVMMPVWSGTRQGRRDAYALANLFTGRDIGGLIFGSAAIGAGEKVETDGNYARMSVSIEWQLDH